MQDQARDNCTEIDDGRTRQPEVRGKWRRVLVLLLRHDVGSSIAHWFSEENSSYNRAVIRAFPGRNNNRSYY